VIVSRDELERRLKDCIHSGRTAYLGLKGASRHQQTLVTSLAKKIVAAGGSLRDVQRLPGHASLSTIPRFIDGSRDDKRKAIAML
jgi:site-specific recombinase XerD